MEITKSYLKDLVYKVNGAAIAVHKELGAGLLESIYHLAMIEELKYQKINFVSEHRVKVIYRDKIIKNDLIVDLFVENILPVELKAVESILPIHEAQLYTYMRLLKAPEGLLINFNVKSIFYEGQQTLVNEIFKDLPE